VYIDVGTNLGVQIRKLYEPHHYVRAPMLPIFDRFFGKARASDPALCAFGFEPNPALTRGLTQLQANYRAQGWRVHLFTETAVGRADGRTTLNVPAETPSNPWANTMASLVPLEARLRARAVAGDL
jgi:hypothetical protein